MKFEQITNEAFGAKNAGYTFDKTTRMVVDQELADALKVDRGERFVNGHLDGLCDLDGDLYRGEDGELYAVEWIYKDDGFVPLAWWRLVKAEGRA